jgi:hypothetical protein
LEIPVAEEFAEYYATHEPEGLLALAKRFKVDAAKIRREKEDELMETEGGKREEVVEPPVAKKAAAVKTAKPAAKKKAVAKKPTGKTKAKK